MASSLNQTLHIIIRLYQPAAPAIETVPGEGSCSDRTTRQHTAAESCWSNRYISSGKVVISATSTGANQ
ncbi:hypothetical protein WJX74_006092 [Apatococcus lobatus]|uniref:Uncharacterized protein n=1 Tax=Apatococcus lobatus TaxID=904363 RepID=A0AAW1QIB9_9CHLO